MAKCKICGSRVNDTDVKCPVCGGAISSNEGTPVSNNKSNRMAEPTTVMKQAEPVERKSVEPPISRVATQENYSAGVSGNNSMSGNQVYHNDFHSSVNNSEKEEKKFNWYAFFFMFANSGYNRDFKNLFGGFVLYLLVFPSIVACIDGKFEYGGFVVVLFLIQIVVGIIFGFSVKSNREKSVVGLFVGLVFNFICSAIFRFALAYGWSGIEYMLKSIF